MVLISYLRLLRSYLVGQRQIDRRAIKYVIKNGKKINSVGLYDVYVLEK